MMDVWASRSALEVVSIQLPSGCFSEWRGGLTTLSMAGIGDCEGG